MRMPCLLFRDIFVPRTRLQPTSPLLSVSALPLSFASQQDKSDMQTVTSFFFLDYNTFNVAILSIHIQSYVKRYEEEER